MAPEKMRRRKRKIESKVKGNEKSRWKLEKNLKIQDYLK